MKLKTIVAVEVDMPNSPNYFASVICLHMFTHMHCMLGDGGGLWDFRGSCIALTEAEAGYVKCVLDLYLIICKACWPHLHSSPPKVPQLAQWFTNWDRECDIRWFWGRDVLVIRQTSQWPQQKKRQKKTLLWRYSVVHNHHLYPKKSHI